MIPIASVVGFLKGLPWRYLALALAAVIFLGSIYGAGRRDGSGVVLAEWEREKAQHAADHAEAIAEVLKVQQNLSLMLEQAKKDRANEVARVDATHRALLERLRNRPEERAPSGVPDTPNTGVGCTGAGLAGPDGRFLAGYAADAARLEAAYRECRAGYQAAQQRLDALAQ